MTYIKYRNQGPALNPARSMSHLFDDFFGTPMHGGRQMNPMHGLGGAPAVNIREGQDGFTFMFAAPGYGKEQFDIQVNNLVLTVGAQRRPRISYNAMGQPMAERADVAANEAPEANAAGNELEGQTVYNEGDQHNHGNGRDEEQTRLIKREFSRRGFERSFTLPQSVDTNAIEARYEDGILYVTVPKRQEAKSGARNIHIG